MDSTGHKDIHARELATFVAELTMRGPAVDPIVPLGKLLAACPAPVSWVSTDPRTDRVVVLGSVSRHLRPRRCVMIPERRTGPMTARDREAIETLQTTWMTAVAAGDARALADLVTPDYEAWPHGGPAFGGPDTVVAAMGAALVKYAITQSYDAIETIVAGEWAFQRGIERIRAVPHDGGPTQEVVRRALLILRRGDDGRWRYARGMTNGLPDDDSEPT